LRGLISRKSQKGRGEVSWWRKKKGEIWVGSRKKHNPRICRKKVEHTLKHGGGNNSSTEQRGVKKGGRKKKRNYSRQCISVVGFGKTKKEIGPGGADGNGGRWKHGKI